MIGGKSGLASYRKVVRALRLLAPLTWLVFLLLPAMPQTTSPDLTSLSLEDLMNTKVTSVSKTEQKLSRTASAIFVITTADIARSGATNIPDLLRMVPGVDVAQIDANTWAISARGLNGRFSNELLVMVDGRNVYTPTFGGVFWDVLDLPLEDIERIEVIRGPGATVWGANAVNGVINIITKKAADTKGGMVVAGGGNLDQFGTAQYGGGLGKIIDYRIFTKYFNQNHLPGPDGGIGADEWHLLHGGFRTDIRASARDNLTIQGNLYTGRERIGASFLPSITSPGMQDIDVSFPLSGGFVQAAWDHTCSATSSTTLLISYDNYKREDELMELRRTFAAEFTHRFAWGTRQGIVWGANFSTTDSDTDGSLAFSLHPANVNMQVFSLFVQDEISLLPDKLYLTVGTKLDHSYYTGFNLLPGIRVAWTPRPRHMFWAAVSRAYRTPSEVDTATRIDFAGFPGPGGTPTLAAVVGNPRFGNEGLTSYEAGYRNTPLRNFSIDLAAYYSHYDHQQTTEPAPPFFESSPTPPHLVLPFTYLNLMHGEAHGFELAASLKVTDRWTLSPGYAFEQIHMHLEAPSQDAGSVEDAEGSSPVNNAQLRSHVDFRHNLSWDISSYFVDRLKSEEIPSYTRIDTGLTWRWTEGLSMSLVGENLVKDRHLEFIDIGSIRSTLIKRSVYAKFTWLF